FGDKYRTDNPILLQQHREKMHKAMKDVNDARAVAKLKKTSPVDIFVWPKHQGQDHFLEDRWIDCYDGKGMHV
ncbi:hypothetical protein Tco_1349204, partial [Tanacetum coccineum]